jgi:hypothetical protein
MSCDHKFVDSPQCLKCGWRPPPLTKTDRVLAAVADGAETALEIQAVLPDLPVRTISAFLANLLVSGRLRRTGRRRYPQTATAYVTVAMGRTAYPPGRPLKRRDVPD